MTIIIHKIILNLTKILYLDKIKEIENSVEEVNLMWSNQTIMNLNNLLQKNLRTKNNKIKKVMDFKKLKKLNLIELAKYKIMRI